MQCTYSDGLRTWHGWGGSLGFGAESPGPGRKALRLLGPCGAARVQALAAASGRMGRSVASGLMDG